MSESPVKGVRPRTIVEQYGMSPGAVYSAIASGSLKARRFGRHNRGIVVLKEDLDEWLGRVPAERDAGGGNMALKADPIDLRVNRQDPDGYHITNHRLRWRVVADIEQATAVVLERLAELRKEPGVHPSGLSVEWDGERRYGIICEITYDKDDRA